MSVAKSKSNYLRVFHQEEISPVGDESPPSVTLPSVLRAFQQATGWSLEYVPGQSDRTSEPTGLRWSAPVNPGVGATLGHLRLKPVGEEDSGAPANVSSKAARQLASALAEMLGELVQTRTALWQREAELAAGVPLVPHPDEPGHLAARLQAVLKAGAEALSCHAAALYVLDDATTALKLRACWGLPQERFLASARPLRGALADLEAMLGHAVVLEDAALMKHWNPPEDFPSAVCVPVSTPTTILGTLWVFSQAKRDFTELQTNLAEIIAGRVAADLEREMLLTQAVTAIKWQRQAAAIERMQRAQLPAVPPLLEGWDVAGWCPAVDRVCGHFFDWFSLPDRRVAIALGNAAGSRLEAAFSAATLRAALRSHGQYHRDPAALLGQVNLTLWTGSAGDQFAALFCGLLETTTGCLRYASAGRFEAMALGADGCQRLALATPVLGRSPETRYQQSELSFREGDLLALATESSVAFEGDPEPSPFVPDVVAALSDHRHRAAKQLLAAMRERLKPSGLLKAHQTRGMLVLKRQP